jgi:hypothetical protein
VRSFPGRCSRALLIVTATFLLLGGAIPALAAASALSARPIGSRTQAATPVSAPVWTKPAPLPAAKSGTVTTGALPTAIGCIGTSSCAVAGSVAAKGSVYDDSEAFVDDQTAGAWKQPHLLGGLTTLDHGDPAGVNAVSCSSPGNCVAGGHYDYPPSPDFDRYEGFLAMEKNGVWGAAQNVPGLNALNTDEDAQVTSVSCPEAGYCTAAGYYTQGIIDDSPYNGSAFTINEAGGKWQQVQTVAGASRLGADPDINNVSVSCVAPGNCTAAGSATTSAAEVAFATTEKAGKWGGAQLIKGMTLLTKLSCSASGDCAGIGENQIATSGGGTWSSAKTLGVNVVLNAVSCGSPGNCLAGGYNVANNLASSYAFIIAEKAGKLNAGGPLSGVAALGGSGGSSGVSTVSCGGTNDCAIGGSYQASTGTDGLSSGAGGFVSEQLGSSLSQPQLFSAGGVGVISCTDTGSCGALLAPSPAGGLSGLTSYLDFSQKLLPTSTAIGLSAATVTYGHESVSRISVSVHPEADDPNGKVVVKAGKATVCVITLSSAKGSCKLSAKQLKPGSYAVTATYTGASGFRSSVSAARKLTVRK